VLQLPPLPETPVSPKFQLYDTCWKALPLIALSLVPVASKNTKNGDTPALRTALARNANPPLVAVQEAPAVVVVTEVTFTVADRLAVPPEPVQVRV